MKKKKRIFVLLVLLILLSLFSFTALAGENKYNRDWSPKRPSPYQGREYTHEQYVRLYLDDGVLHKNNVVYNGYMPVFCLPGKLTEGYTAAESENLLKDNPFTYAVLRSTGLEAKVAGGIHYLLIHNGLKENPYIQATMMDTNASIKNDPVAPGVGKLTPGPDDATVQDPYLVKYGKPFDVAWVGKASNQYKGFYYATTYLDGEAGGQVGSINLTADAAKALVTHKGGVQVNTDVYIKYDYNLFLTGLRQKTVARNPGEEEKWTVQLFNQTPFETVKEKTHLRAFIQEEGSEPVLVDSTEVNLKQGQSISNFMWDFSYPLPQKDFTLIVTANMIYLDGEWVKEPLVTVTQDNIPLYGEDGEKEVTYADNMVTSDLVGGSTGGGCSNGGGNNRVTGKPDLAALNLELYDSEDNLMLDTLITGESYKASAVFTNYYSKGGFATVRLYAKQGNNYQLRDRKLVFLEPGKTFYIDKDDGWIFTPGSNTATPVITIDYPWDNGWSGEKFRLESGARVTEDNYSNNIFEKTYSTERNSEPRKEGHYASYYPVKIIKEPVYRTEKQKVWNDKWDKIPYEFDDRKPRLHFRIISQLFGGPAYAAEGRPAWHTLEPGLEVYGYWINLNHNDKNYNFLVECDSNGKKTGWAYVNNGTFKEVEVKKLDHYEEKEVIDTSQPKRYLYPPEVFPSPRYMGESLYVMDYGFREPEEVAYPYGDYLTEEWRSIIIPIYNPNKWPVKIWVRTVINGDDWKGYMELDARETKWVRALIPENAQIGGYHPYKTGNLTVVTKVVENYDPYAPDKYKLNPPADEYDSVLYWCDATGLEFSGPKWYDERDAQKVFRLVPAFKEVMEWQPDDLSGRIGKPSYKTVPGYRWVTVEVSQPYAVSGYPSSVYATEDDIENMRAIGPGMLMCDTWLGFSLDELKNEIKSGDKSGVISFRTESGRYYRERKIYQKFIAENARDMRETIGSAFETMFKNYHTKPRQYFDNPYNEYDNCSSFIMDGQRYYYDHVRLSDSENLYIVFKQNKSGYLKSDGSTLKEYQEDHFKYHVVLRNWSDFIMHLTGFKIRYDDRFRDWYPFPAGGWDLTLEPGEAEEINGNFKLDSERRFSPDNRGEINGIAGIDVREAYGEVTINAVAGAYNYNEDDEWIREFKPYIRKTMFDFEEIMTPSDLARFGEVQGAKIRTNLAKFLNGNSEKMECSATYSRDFD